MQKTINYQLPLWESKDITSWLTQLNEAMCKIDLALHGLALRTQPIGEQPEDVVADIEKLNKEYTDLKKEFTELKTVVDSNSSAVTTLQTQQTTTTTNVNTLLTNTANLDVRVTAIEAALITINATITKIQTEQQGQESAIEALDARVSSLEQVQRKFD